VEAKKKENTATKNSCTLKGMIVSLKNNGGATYGQHNGI
jgi:hypothetical protein